MNDDHATNRDCSTCRIPGSVTRAPATVIRTPGARGYRKWLTFPGHWTTMGGCS